MAQATFNPKPLLEGLKITGGIAAGTVAVRLAANSNLLPQNMDGGTRQMVLGGGLVAVNETILRNLYKNNRFLRIGINVAGSLMFADGGLSKVSGFNPIFGQIKDTLPQVRGQVS